MTATWMPATTIQITEKSNHHFLQVNKEVALPRRHPQAADFLQLVGGALDLLLGAVARLAALGLCQKQRGVDV